MKTADGKENVFQKTNEDPINTITARTQAQTAAYDLNQEESSYSRLHQIDLVISQQSDWIRTLLQKKESSEQQY